MKDKFDAGERDLGLQIFDLGLVRRRHDFSAVCFGGFVCKIQL